MKKNEQEYPKFDTGMHPLSFMDAKKEAGTQAEIENSTTASWDDIGKLANQRTAEAEQRKIDEILAPFKTEPLSNQKYILTALRNKKELEVTVPGCVQIIGENAFAGSDVINITLPEGLIKIEKGAFQNCTSLEEINFPSTLRIIGDSAFAGCSALDIEAPEKVRVGKDAFKDTIPDIRAEAIAAEERRKQEEAERQRRAAEEAARQKAEAKAAEERRKQEEAERQRRAAEEAARREAEVKAAEERRKQKEAERQRRAAEEAARREAEAKAAEERRKQKEAERQRTISDISDTIHALNQEKKHDDYWYQQIDELSQKIEKNKNIINFEHDINITDLKLLDKLYDAYNKKVKHNKAKDGLLKWLKMYAATALAVIFAVCAVVFVFLASRTFAIMALCAGAASIVAAIIGVFQNEYDDDTAFYDWCSIVVSGIFIVVALIQWFFAFGVSDFVIKDGVLKDYYGNEQVVEVPDGIVEIKESAFWHVFNQNGKVEQVILPEGVKSIGNAAFSGCKSLAEINLPESLKTIFPKAFERCVSLETISIPDGVQEIDAWTFENCSRLREVYIGSGVKKIGNGAFKNCIFLETIYYNGTEAEWNAITKGEGSGWFQNAWDENTGDYTIVFLK